ncbi:hypothetical protein PSAB6_100012 [Paraburkholderia sabiae]|nr:hypothetical protein PSAB6_100012 [Paraburkholderia sabiae]
MACFSHIASLIEADVQRRQSASAKVMNSLRAMVERWLAHMPPCEVSFARFGSEGSGRRCHVRVDVHRPEGDLAIHFFRHRDGMWRVFPPTSVPVAMRVLPAGIDD